MAARLQVSSEHGLPDFDPSLPSYWKPENHSDSNPLRQELWMPCVQEFMLPAAQIVVPLSYESSVAMLRYREELKMHAALRDAGIDTSDISQSPMNVKIPGNDSRVSVPPVKHADSMHDPAFLDERARQMALEWPRGSATMKDWWSALQIFRDQLDVAINQLPHSNSGVFVKLSVRSPKDSALCVTAFDDHLTEYINASSILPSEDTSLSDDVAAIKQASWLALRCFNADQALQVLLRSDRIYLDILQHQLFNQKMVSQLGISSSALDVSSDKISVLSNCHFNLNVHVCQFFDGFDPDWEFRGFVSKGQRTGLTAYSPWTYNPRIIAQKEKILEVVQSLWDRIPTDSLPMSDYCIDFAVKPDLSQVWIVEINAFLPPLAGSGLFEMHMSADRDLIMNGPFTFRIRETPVQQSDFVIERINEQTGQKSTMIMQPAPAEIMSHVANLRRHKHGMSQLPHSKESNSSPMFSPTAPKGATKCQPGTPASFHKICALQ